MIPFNLAAWALKHHVSLEALDELRCGVLAEVPPPPPPPRGASPEAYAQSLVRLEAPHKGVHLWRNNVGVLEDKTGRPVRFGLMNDSAQLNARIKSSDLIGVRPVTITPQHVGQTIGQFVARECKRPDWTFHPNDARETAQQAFIALVLSLGGDAAFATGQGTL